MVTSTHQEFFFERNREPLLLAAIFAHTYDSLSRPSQVTLTINGTSYPYGRSYNSDGRLATLSYPSGFVAKYVYTTLGYLAQIQDNATAAVLWTAKSRDAEMHLTEAQTGSGGVDTIQYFDPKTGLVEQIRASADGSDDGTTAEMSYGFDTIGNLSSRSDNFGGSEQFCYDALNRLTKYSLNGATCHAGGTLKTVAYDDIGNIVLKSDLADTNGGTGAYTYNLPGHTTPHAVQSILGTVNGVRDPSYRYDADGNLTCEYTGPNCSHGAITKETDAYWSFNMTHTIGDGATSLTLTYDSEHARITQLLTTASTNVTTNYLNDPVSGAIAEKVVSGSTNTWNDYLMADGKLVGERICSSPSPSCPAANATWQYFILDHLGSVSVVTDGATKQVTARESFDAWGKQRNPDWSDDLTCSSGLTSPTTRGFTSQEDIASLCLINLNARLYDPSIGRFLSADSVIPDPYDGQSYNRYTYVNNRPLSFTDPTGHDGDCSSSVCPEPPEHWNGNNNGGRPDRDAHPEMEEFGNFLIQETHTLGGDVKVTISYNVTGEAMQTQDPTKTEIGMSGNQGASQSQSDSSSNPLVTQQTLSASYVAGRTLETASDEINPATGQVVATADSEDTLPGHYVVSSGAQITGGWQQGNSGLFDWFYKSYSGPNATLGEWIYVKYKGNTKNLQWIQTYTDIQNGVTVAKDKNDHEGGSKFPFNDSNNVGKRSSGLFIDDPGATVADEKLRFDLSAVRLDAAGNQTVLGTFKYGFDRNGADINLLPVVRTGP